MELNEARVEELDIETVLNFAIEAIGDASRLAGRYHRPKATVPAGFVSQRLSF